LYNTPGTYLVQLTATNENGDSLLTQMDYIEVLPLPSGTFTTEMDMLTITFTPEGENVTNYSWNFGDATTSDEMNPVHTYTEPGDYLVVLTLENECGSVTISETITVMTTGLADLEEATQWSLYPNPSHGNLWLDIVGWPQYTQGKLTVFNALGEKMGIHPLALATGDSRTPLQLTLPAGIYWLRLEAAGFAGGMKKIVVQ
jgi:PKD repeat protein